MSLTTLEQVAVADIKAKLAGLSTEAQHEVVFAETWATKNFEWVVLGAFVLGFAVKWLF